MNKDAKIFVTGHRGMVGSALVRRLEAGGYTNILTRTHQELDLLDRPLEKTNEPYAVAKIAGIKLCEAYKQQYGREYVSVMPTNLYGPNDNYDLETSHVLPALLRKAHEAKSRGENALVVWGTGKPRREFFYVDVLADACVFLMERDYTGSFLNIGTGQDVTIHELAETIMAVVGFKGEVVFNSSKPDGTMRKVLDVSKLKQFGWNPQTSLKQGVELVYRDVVVTFPILGLRQKHHSVELTS